MIGLIMTFGGMCSAAIFAAGSPITQTINGTVYTASQFTTTFSTSISGTLYTSVANVGTISNPIETLISLIVIFCGIPVIVIGLKME